MNLRESVSNQTDVAFGLAKHILSTAAKDKNLVFSPLLINFVLSIIASGSKGPTLDQLLGFLKSDSTDLLHAFWSEKFAAVFAEGSAAGGPRLSLANGVWVDKSVSLKPSFKQVVDSVYKAALDRVDFQTKMIP